MIPMTLGEFIRTTFDTALITINSQEHLIENVIDRGTGVYLVFADDGMMCLCEKDTIVMVSDPIADYATYVHVLPVAQIIPCSPKDDPYGESPVYIYDYDDVVILPEYKVAYCEP